MKKLFFFSILLLCMQAALAQNDSVRFYWHHVQLEASEGGVIYGTGDWRLPLSDADFGTSVTVKWVIAGLNNRSSCYAWVKPDQGYYFAGWYAQNGLQQVATDTVEARLWTTTSVAMMEDGIVSGNDLYALQPSDTIRAVFLPLNPTALPAVSDSEQSERAYDVLGRIVRTSQNGLIIIKGGRKQFAR